MKTCQYCGVESENKFQKCTSCGAPLKNVTTPKDEKVVFYTEEDDGVDHYGEEYEEAEPEAEEGSGDGWIVALILCFFALVGLVIAWSVGAFDKKDSDPSSPPPPIQSFYDVAHNNLDVVEFQCADRGVKKPNTVAEGFGCSMTGGTSCIVLWDSVCPYLVQKEDYDIIAHTQQCEDSPNPLTNCNGNNIVAYAYPDYQDPQVAHYLPFGFPFKWYGCVTMRSGSERIGGGLLFWTYVDDYGWIDAYQVEGGCGPKTTD